MAINETLQNICVENLSYNSTNLSLTLINNNQISAKLMTDYSWWLYFKDTLPFIGVIFGVLIGFYLNNRQARKKEEKELNRYEYTLIVELIDIAKSDQKIARITSFYEREKKKPEFIKIENFKIFKTFIFDIMEGRDPKIDELKTILKKKENEI